jgi:hypothetical protein
MKRKHIICFVSLSFAIVILFTGCAHQRPRDELITSVPSPDGIHMMKIYRNNGGATVDWSTTISIQKVGSSTEKNVYFHYHEKDPDEAVWVDNDTVRINGMELDIHNEYYESFDRK